MYPNGISPMIKEFLLDCLIVFSASGQVGQPNGPGPGVPSRRPVCPSLAGWPELASFFRAGCVEAVEAQGPLHNCTLVPLPTSKL